MWFYDKFDDPEQRYRQRYADLVVNPQVKDTFVKRTKITNVIREFYNNMGFLEVETPILQPIPGGAGGASFCDPSQCFKHTIIPKNCQRTLLKKANSWWF